MEWALKTSPKLAESMLKICSTRSHSYYSHISSQSLHIGKQTLHKKGSLENNEQTPLHIGYTSTEEGFHTWEPSVPEITVTLHHNKPPENYASISVASSWLFWYYQGPTMKGECNADLLQRGRRFMTNSQAWLSIWYGFFYKIILNGVKGGSYGYGLCACARAHTNCIPLQCTSGMLTCWIRKLMLAFSRLTSKQNHNHVQCTCMCIPTVLSHYLMVVTAQSFAW